MAIIDNFGFCGSCYQAITPVIDAQDSLNLYPESELATSKSQIALIGTPGLSLFTTLPHQPIRALAGGNGQLFAVAGTHFYRVNSDGSYVDGGTLTGSLGTGPAQIVLNGNDILVMDSSNSTAYAAENGPPSISFGIRAFSIEYLDTFYFALNALQTNQINQSDPLNALSWNALAFAVRTDVADFINAISVINGQVWTMGQKNLTIFYDAGLSPFSLAKIGGATINVGCLCRFSVVKLDNTIFWVGGDDRGFAVVWRGSGTGNPVRVSTHAIEQLMASYNIIGEATVDAGNVRGFAYQEDGHTFYVLNFNGANGGLGATLAYDITTGMWHRRCYLNPGSGAQERIIADCFASVADYLPDHSTVNVVGDYRNGNIYFQKLSYTSDNGDPKIYQRTCPHTGGKDLITYFKKMTYSADIGSASIVQTYSNDGGRTFPSWTSRTIAKSNAKAPEGTFGRYVARRLGDSRDRVFRATVTTGTQLVRFVNAYLDAYQQQFP